MKQMNCDTLTPRRFSRVKLQRTVPRIMQEVIIHKASGTGSCSRMKLDFEALMVFMTGYPSSHLIRKKNYV